MRKILFIISSEDDKKVIEKTLINNNIMYRLSGIKITTETLTPTELISFREYLALNIPHIKYIIL